MKKIIVLLIPIFAIAFSACRSTLRTNYFLINTDPAGVKSAKQYPLTLSVNNVRAPSRYGDQIFFRASAYEVGFYEYSRWVEPPSEMVKSALVNALKDSGLFLNVEPAGVILNPDLTLQSSLKSFDQIVNKDGFLADCAIDFELLNGIAGNTIWTYHARAKVKQEKKDKFVATLSEATQKTINDAISGLSQSQALEEISKNKTNAAKAEAEKP